MDSGIAADSALKTRANALMTATWNDAKMKLSDLLTGLARPDARTGAVEAAGVTSDSRKVKRGDIFVAVPGTKSEIGRASCRERV